MDKTILKKFAIESRQELMEKVANKINRYFVDEEFNVNQNGEVYVLVNDKHTLRLTKSEYENRQLLVKRIKEITLEQVIEEAAYTWFNRIIAIRYMEIHDYLPLTKDNQSLGVRVLSSKDNTPDPEIMKISNLINPDLDIEFNKEYYGTIQDNNKRFEYILLLVCKKLGNVIPQVFDGITDYIDILVPDNLLNDSGYVTKLLKDVSEENFAQVEIIGWLYQYYNQIEKDRVISAKKAYKKNEIPFATQLFTPDWIVKYMVENSLGKYWIEHGGNIDLIENWKYFIKDNLNMENKTLTVAEVNNMTVEELGNTQVSRLIGLDPKEIKCIDPCCGSGHILVYMFEVLFQIYESYGYSKKAICELILRNNLYGLDIDDRAGQLSILSVLLKAREYDKDIFNKDIVRNLNIMSIQESDGINKKDLDILKSQEEDPKGLMFNDTVDYVYDVFQNAKEIGSLLIIEKKDYDKVLDEIDEITNEQIDLFDIDKIIMLNEKFAPLLKIAKILSSKYDIVVTNPPYMNNSVMNINLKKYIYANYINVKSDMFSAFVIKNSCLSNNDTYLGFMTPYVWMFISSYEKLREYIIDNMNISSLIQLEYSALEEATVPICSFVLKKTYQKEENGNYFRLVDWKGGMSVQENSYLKILNDKNSKYHFKKDVKQFKEIPNMVISYWLTDNLINILKNSNKINEFSEVKQGMTTSDNKRFLRYWYEVNPTKIGFKMKSLKEAKESKFKWFPYNKGGEYRKWFGNDEYVVNYYNDGEEMEAFHNELNKTSSGGRIKNKEYYFRKSISWSKISSASLAFRFKDYGFIFDVAGSSIFINDDNLLLYILGLFNSKLGMYIIGQISPTLNFEAEQIKQMPFEICNDKKNRVIELVKNSIEKSKDDWNSFETSWDFKVHPLIKYNKQYLIPIISMDNVKNIAKIFDDKVGTLETAFTKWTTITRNNFNQLKQNEEELNRIFIDIYGLQDELTPNVEDKDVTIRKADRVRDIKSLISYAVGCMFGRYSLDEDGIIFAGGEFNNNKYNSFDVDVDNIIPITEENYFGDDIVSRFKKFIEIVYGKETLYENLEFIAETLGKKNGENSEETIRRYFINDFYNEHVKMYQKRPIYWLFDSGKKNGFKCLIYMHRYNEGLVSKIRLDYLHRMQNTYEKELKEISDKLSDDVDLTSKRELSKRQADLSSKLQETNEYDEKIAHIADQKIKIDLDDGVVVNYAKFSVKNPKTGKDESILSKIK